MILAYSKALVPVVLGGLLLLLSKIGVTPEMQVQDALELILASVLVYFIPNKK